MAKYLKNNNGDITEETTVQASAGAGSADKIVSLDSGGKIDMSMIPSGIGADTISINASENLGAGDFVNIYNNTGTPAVRKADASNAAKRANGYVLSAVTSGQPAAIYFDDSNTSVTGQTAGDVYLSATTPGQATATVPTGTGKIVQKLGVATSATTIHVNIQQPIVLA